MFWLLTIIPFLCGDTQSTLTIPHTQKHNENATLYHRSSLDSIHATEEKKSKATGITECNVPEMECQMRGLALANPIISNRPAVTIHKAFIRHFLTMTVLICKYSFVCMSMCRASQGPFRFAAET
jgi:hypothetical protein